MPRSSIVAGASKLSNPLAVVLVAMVLGGCAASAHQASQKPQYQAKAIAVAPVGEVSPVFVAVRCIHACPDHLALSPRDVRAVTGEGKLAEALPFEYAVAGAGGAIKLAPALTDISDTEKVAEILGKSFALGARIGGPQGAPLTAPAGLLVGAIASGYLVANPEQLQETKLRPLALPGETDPKMGWVFFAKDTYRQVRITVRPPGNSEPGAEAPPLEVITLPWLELSPAATTELRHQVERSNLSQFVELPPVEPESRGGGGISVGILRAVDARSGYSITELFEVGPEIAKQSEDLMANELANRGYAVERMPPAPGHSAPQRAVAITVLSAIKPPPAASDRAVLRTAIEVGVIDAQGRPVFSGMYVGEDPYPLAVQPLPFFTVSIETASAMGQTLNDALGLAIAKACSDPAFVAAIGGGPRPQRADAAAPPLIK